MSRISNLCLWIAIAILVQLKIFECAEQCNCRCRNNFVCNDIDRLTASDLANAHQWERWRMYLLHLKMLHAEFNHVNMMARMDLVETMARTLEMKIDNISPGSSSRDFKVWTDKINSVENKTESIEGLKRRLDEAESRAERLETALENAKKDLKINVHSIEGRLCLVENRTNCSVPTVEAEKGATDGMETIISVIGERIALGENETDSFETTTEVEN